MAEKDEKKDEKYEPKHAGKPEPRDPEHVIPHQDADCPPHQYVVVGTVEQCKFCNAPK